MDLSSKTFQVDERQPKLSFGAQAVLDYSLQHEGLLDGPMVCSAACLCGCVQLLLGSYFCESSVYNRHEEFGEWWIYGDAAVVIGVRCASFVLKDWYHFGFSP